MGSRQSTAGAHSTDAPAVALRPGAAPLYLMVENVRKEHNMGSMLRSACAFGVKSVLLCGTHGVKSFASANGAGRMTVLPFPDGVEPAVAWLRQEVSGISICGVEITSASESIFRSPWRGPTALLMGCERSGLSKKALHCCDHVVHIPQFGSRVASLNVATAAAVAMSWYVAWAGAAYEGGLGVEPAARQEGADGGQGRFQVADDGADDGMLDAGDAERQVQESVAAGLREARAARRAAEEASEEGEGCDLFAAEPAS